LSGRAGSLWVSGSTGSSAAPAGRTALPQAAERDGGTRNASTSRRKPSYPVNPQLTLPSLAASRSGGSSGFVGSAAIAVGVCGIFAASARVAPATALPATVWTALFLALAIESDVRSLRIPNWLTFGGIAAVLAHAAASGGSMVGPAVGGAVAALVALFLPFALGGLGAGDVKAMMVLGALWGPDPVLPVLFWALLAGGTLAIARLVARGEGVDLCVRWGHSAWVTLSTRRVTYFRPAAGSAAAGGLPFALAIGLGASLYQIWGAPWA
jgi:prepilin peptidase CpaA